MSNVLYILRNKLFDNEKVKNLADSVNKFSYIIKQWRINGRCRERDPPPLSTRQYIFPNFLRFLKLAKI